MDMLLPPPLTIQLQTPSDAVETSAAANRTAAAAVPGAALLQHARLLISIRPDDSKRATTTGTGLD